MLKNDRHEFGGNFSGTTRTLRRRCICEEERQWDYMVATSPTGRALIRVYCMCDWLKEKAQGDSCRKGVRGQHYCVVWLPALSIAMLRNIPCRVVEECHARGRQQVLQTAMLKVRTVTCYVHHDNISCGLRSGFRTASVPTFCSRLVVSIHQALSSNEEDHSSRSTKVRVCL